MNDLPEFSRPLLEPESITVIGASSQEEKVGYAVFRNIIASGYPGKIYPVNPHAAGILGVECYRDVLSIPGRVDLALVVVPAASVPDVIDQCGKKGIPFAVVISAGFRETGIEGRNLEKEMFRRAAEKGVRILGPNCLGFINTSVPLNASFSARMPCPGNIGIISQSGAICTSLVDWSHDLGFGLSKLISLGNNTDLNESDFLEFLSLDSQTRVISMYIEGVREGTRFLDVLSVACRRKPVVIFKAGKTQSGARAVSSHTGSLAGSQVAYYAAAVRAGALMVDTLGDFISLSNSLSKVGEPRGRNVAILTNAGGPGIIASDACDRYGLSLALLSPMTTRELRDRLPAAATVHNPVDVLGDADASRYSDAFRLIAADPNVDSILVILTPQAMTKPAETASSIVKLAGAAGKVIVCSFMGGESTREAEKILEKEGIPNLSYPDEAVRVLSLMFSRAEMTRKPISSAPRFNVRADLTAEILESYVSRERAQVEPEDCLMILEAYGIPYAEYRVSGDVERAVEIAEELGYPVVLKIVSPHVLHKTDIGGVITNVENPEELERGFEEIISRTRRHFPDAEIHGVAVQKMVPKGREIILGMTRDPQFGPLLMVGFGGIYVETFGDVSFRIVPVTYLDAAQMLRELKAFRLLEGVRGEKRADIEALTEVILRVSQLAHEHRELLEMDINPLMVYNSGDGCVCVDVRMTVGGIS